MMSNTVSFVRLGSQEREGRIRYVLLLGALLSLAILKLCLIGTERLSELTLSIAFDSCGLLLLWLLSELSARPRKVWSEYLAGALFYPPFYFVLGLIFAHTWFFDAAIERRLTVFDATLAGIGEFFGSALPTLGYVALGLFLLGMHGVAYWAGVGLERPRPRRALWWLVPLFALVGVASARAPRTPSVLFDTCAELYALARLPKVTPKKIAKVDVLLASLDKSQAAPRTLETPFSKVIVLVMETMTEHKLREESVALPKSTFLKAQTQQLHRYTRYFPNNQDSRTGMLDMLMSRLIPYEAYSDVDVAKYQGLGAQPSLANLMQEHGYRAAFAVSQVAIEEVVSDLAWDQTLNLNEQDIAAAKRQQLLCFAPDEWENGCEDLALLPKVLDFVHQNERAFIYQEFIWGHDGAYNDASGSTNTAYYSRYVDRLIEGLRARNVLDDTLIVLTSDHGFRDKSKQRELWVYEIPLMFYAARFQELQYEQLLSHVDFKDLLFAELRNQPFAPAHNPLVMIVGPTGSGVVTTIGANGSFTLLKQRFGKQLLLEQQHGAPANNEPTADQLLYLFQAYRSRFDERLK